LFIFSLRVFVKIDCHKMEISPSNLPQGEQKPADKWMDMCDIDEDSYYRIDKWYPDIQEWTFPTRTASMSMDEALALKKYAELLRQTLRSHDLKSRKRKVGEWGHEDYTAAKEEMEKGFPPQELQRLRDLRTKIDALMGDFVASGGYAFLKLSTISPKDSAFYTVAMREQIAEDIKNSKAEPNSPEAEAEDITSFVRASCRCLAVQSGEEALQLFALSRRVLADITSAELMYNDKPEQNFTLSLVAREWNPRVLPEWEFRVFVFNNKITSATQYNNITFVPDMLAKKEAVKQFILNFWEKVKGHIRFPTYTMDLALEPKLEHAYIIELNGPPPSAGTSLFDWNNPDDRLQIESGDTFELRINERLPPDVKEMIYQPIRRYIDTLRGRPVPDETYKHTSCSNCRRFPISKTFYHCEQCSDFDLCSACMRSVKKHDKTHTWAKIGEGEDGGDAGGGDKRCSIL